MIDQAVPELVEVTSTAQACELLGKPRATLYRARRAPGTPVPVRRGAPPNKLSPAEAEHVLGVLRSARFIDKSVGQVYATLLDEGSYLCSMSTMYRLLRAHGEVRERRRQATHPPRTRPELVARGPDEVWSWDITHLRGPGRPRWYELYVVLDIFSRYSPHQLISATESGEQAHDFLLDAIACNGGSMPATVHADRGTSMTSKPVSVLLADLDITRSHSRPRVSNDNPYSEAQFKTLKYCPAFPERFGSLPHARDFTDEFFDYYNHSHKHSALGWHTPASVHHGTAKQIQAARAEVLTAAWQANPTRFGGRKPQPPALPAEAWINPPQPAEIQST